MKVSKFFTVALMGIAFSSQVFGQAPTDTITRDTTVVDTIVVDEQQPVADGLFVEAIPMGQDTNVDTTVVEDPVPTPEPTPETGLTDGTLVDLLSANVGKTATEATLFSNALLAERAKALLGSDFEVVTTRCDIETPIAIAGEIFTFGGCDDVSNPTLITTYVYDATNDNLNIVVKRDGVGKVFAEKAELPQATNAK